MLSESPLCLFSSTSKVSPISKGLTLKKIKVNNKLIATLL